MTSSDPDALFLANTVMTTSLGGWPIPAACALDVNYFARTRVRNYARVGSVGRLKRLRLSVR